MDATCFRIGLRGRELHPEGGRIHSVLFTKSETLDSCRFETKMRQNAPNPTSISIFSGSNTPKGEEFIEFLFTESETLDSYRCELVKQKCVRMHQILFHFIFFCILNGYRESLYTFNMQSNTSNTKKELKITI